MDNILVFWKFIPPDKPDRKVCMCGSGSVWTRMTFGQEVGQVVRTLYEIIDSIPVDDRVKFVFFWMVWFSYLLWLTFEYYLCPFCLLSFLPMAPLATFTSTFFPLFMAPITMSIWIVNLFFFGIFGFWISSWWGIQLQCVTLEMNTTKIVIVDKIFQ